MPSASEPFHSLALAERPSSPEPPYIYLKHNPKTHISPGVLRVSLPYDTPPDLSFRNVRKALQWESSGSHMRIARSQGCEAAT